MVRAFGRKVLLMKAITIIITANNTVVSNPKSKTFFRHLLFKSYKKKSALFSSLLEVGKLRPKKNKKLPQDHTTAEQLKKQKYSVCHVPHSGKVKLGTIHIRHSLNQKLLHLKKHSVKNTSPVKILQKPFAEKVCTDHFSIFP